MAKPIRSAKSGSDRSTSELLAYNITVRREDVVSFVGDELRSIDHLNANLLSSADPTIAGDLISPSGPVALLPTSIWHRV
jgi:hypothetical protein